MKYIVFVWKFSQQRDKVAIEDSSKKILQWTEE